MPRRARLRLAGVPLHVVQRGNNRAACFFADGDRLCYLSQLAELAEKFQCAVHAYVLMTNHVHLLLTPAEYDGASLLLRHLGQRYVQYVNRVYGRSGSLWEGLFGSSLVQADIYFLCCQRYIEMNPVRAGVVACPEAYPWSSFASNGLGRRDPLVSPHDEYLKLGLDDARRRSAYVALFGSQLDPDFIEIARKAASAGYALGSERFQKEISTKLGRRAGQGSPGRPAIKNREAPIEPAQAPFV